MSKKSSMSTALVITALVTAALSKELQASSSTTPDSAEADKISRRLLLQQQSLVNELELEQLDLEGNVETIRNAMLAGNGTAGTCTDLMHAQLKLEMHKVKLTRAKATLDEWSAPATA